MPRPEAVPSSNEQQGQQLLQDFEELKSGTGDDAAAEFVFKNRGTVASSLDSEQAFELLHQLPRGTRDPGYRDAIQGALQAVYDRSMKANPGLDFAEAVGRRDIKTGLTFVEKNLATVEPEQVADLVAVLDSLDFPKPQDSNERAEQDKLKRKRDELIGKLEAVQAPESKREKAGSPELKAVNPEEEQRIAEAQSRVDILKEAFEHYQGNLSEGTKAKVERWQRELYQLREVLGEDLGQEVDVLYSQMSDYVHAVDKATRARQVVGLQGRAEDLERARGNDARRQELVAQRKPPQKSKPQGLGARIASWFGRG